MTGPSNAPKSILIGGRPVGPGNPVFVIAEIGINHNGDLDIAKKLIDMATDCGCDAVKFQKRTPELAVPDEYRDLVRETPWGLMSYLDYRRRVEFDREAYAEIDRYCREMGILWFASCWDEPSVHFIEEFNVSCHKVASACLTDHALLKAMQRTGRPILLSTGMSTMNQVEAAVAVIGQDNLVLLHSTSTYPCPAAELNLRVIETYLNAFACPVGYSGHEVGLQATVAAVALGATVVERHITLDRAMWGSDQAASVERAGLQRLVRDIRIIEQAMGDGRKRIYDSERKAMERLRRVRAAE